MSNLNYQPSTPNPKKIFLKARLKSNKKKTRSNSITILHWNCFSLSESRFIEFSLFISDLQENGNHPNIISLNETKINNELANHRINLKGYSCLHKGRHKNPLQGGGVALLIKESIPYSQNSKLKNIILDLEYLCISIKTEFNKSLNILTYYNPPSSELNKKLFQLLKNE